MFGNKRNTTNKMAIIKKNSLKSIPINLIFQSFGPEQFYFMYFL